MKQTVIQLPFDTDKLEAIRQFSPSDKSSLEVEILALIEKIYVKNVPEPVRRFIDYRAPKAGEPPETEPKHRPVRRKTLSSASDSGTENIPPGAKTEDEITSDTETP